MVVVILGITDIEQKRCGYSGIRGVIEGILGGNLAGIGRQLFFGAGMGSGVVATISSASSPLYAVKI